ncbi:baseplate J/gp47 family protein [Romboutsia sp. 1001713B170131_170501_G6]|uniref:baseplate J/gp47 family protein n=1 Tax=Romboutsia sp. 1001713B170131_170501_G6 TaxID=2787108 RepID=UPI0018A98A73|nr:baseplate J/gp47 family protein [Romboutsia sp. 1001713B170131_170501_G6]
MSDINFVNIDAKAINLKIINDFEELIGEPLYPGDERRIFLQQLTPLIVGIKHEINDSAKQNLLRYSRGEKLDGIGEDLFFTERLEAQKASCKCKCKLSKIQDTDIVIPANTRVSPDGNIYFKTREKITICSGQLEAIGILDAEKVGPEFNGFIPGQINLMVDLIPFVESIVNIEMSAGGSNIESDERYRERCRLSQKALSTAGPDDAYIAFAKGAHPSIVDAKPTSPSPGVVKIVILLDGAVTPTEEIINKVLEDCSRRDRRPLTDNVEVEGCEEVQYDINLTYYLDRNHSYKEAIYRKAIEGENLDLTTGAIREYINWQQSNLGKSINPDELRYRIQDAATYSTTTNDKFTAVRKIELISPTHIDIKDIQVAKARNINVVYGGLD